MSVKATLLPEFQNIDDRLSTIWIKLMDIENDLGGKNAIAERKKVRVEAEKIKELEDKANNDRRLKELQEAKIRDEEEKKNSLKEMDRLKNELAELKKSRPQ